MTLLETIKTESDNAFKAGNRSRVSVLRVLIAAIKNKEMTKRPDKLNEDDVRDAVAKEIKDREEGIRIYKGAEAADRVKLLEAEIKVLREFLPAMSEDKVVSLIDEAI